MERGLLPPAELSALSRRELLNLIFEPGFSTARTVTELSGRGVGLDVVRTCVAGLSGRIDVASEPGRGTTFTLTLPVTLAILPALLVDVEGRTFAVPLASIQEIVRVGGGEVRTLERREVIDLRGATLRYVRLGRLFELAPAPPPPARQFAVVVGLGDERLALAVDGLRGQEDVVAKPLGAALGPVPGIAGAADLGGGRTVLVLDVAALLAEVLGGGRRREAS
jgi:two-component system chemotaxis sensor kinase CheA